MIEEIVHKPWGSEVIWAKTDTYVGKMLFIRGGESLSLQYHEKKDETILIVKGQMKFEWFEEGDSEHNTKILKVGDSFHIPPGLRHRMSGVIDTQIIEVSTIELDDIVRLEDRYGRIED